MLHYTNGHRRAISGASLAQLRRRMSAAERACLAADIVDGRVVLQGLTVKAIPEAICLDWCLQFIELFTGFIISPAMLPFRLGRHWLVDVWEAVEACEA